MGGGAERGKPHDSGRTRGMTTFIVAALALLLVFAVAFCLARKPSDGGKVKGDNYPMF